MRKEREGKIGKERGKENEGEKEMKEMGERV